MESDPVLRSEVYRAHICHSIEVFGPVPVGSGYVEFGIDKEQITGPKCVRAQKRENGNEKCFVIE